MSKKHDIDFKCIFMLIFIKLGNIIGNYSGEMFFHCQPVPVSRAAHDAAAAARLWDLSEKLCGLNK